MHSEVHGSLTRETSTGALSHAPTPLEMTALMTVGTVGMMIAGVQPVVLGPLVGEQRLSLAQLGWATTAEFLAIGLVAIFAGMLLEPRRLRAFGIVAGLVVLFANLAAMVCSGLAMVADRLVAGMAEGILLWLPVSMIARSKRPAFWSAAFQGIQTVAQLVFALVVPVTLLDRFGANGAAAGLALTGAIAAAAAPFVPTHFEPLPAVHARTGTAGTRSEAPWAGYVMLGAMFLAAAFTIGVFSYMEPLGTQAGHNAKIVGFAVSACLIGQMIGVGAATLLVDRLRAFRVLIAASVANLTLVALFGSMPGAWMFVAAGFAFGLVWMFTNPFMVPLVIEADPSRRCAVVLTGVLLIGGSAGPSLCAFAVQGTDARGALVVATVCLAVSTAIVVILHTRRRVAARL